MVRIELLGFLHEAMESTGDFLGMRSLCQHETDKHTSVRRIYEKKTELKKFMN